LAFAVFGFLAYLGAAIPSSLVLGPGVLDFIGWGAAGAMVGVIIGLAQWTVVSRFDLKAIEWTAPNAVGWAMVIASLGGLNSFTVTDTGFVGF
jgi:hypothetical protein